MKITIEFYGRLRTQFSDQILTFETENNATIENIFQQLCTEYQQNNNKSDLKPIINDAFAEWQDVANEGDVVGFLPPASGG